MSSRSSRGLGALRPVLVLLLNYKTRLAGATVALLFTAAATLSLGRGLQVLIDQGFGGGRGRGRRTGRGGFFVQANPEEQQHFLQNQRDSLQSRLNDVNRRLDELTGQEVQEN